MTRLGMVVAVTSTLLLAMGCGGEAEQGSSGGGAAGSAGSGGSSGGGGTAGGGTGGGGGFDCPGSPPPQGGTCTPPPPDTSLFGALAHCSWGDDPRPTCRTTAFCDSAGTWTVTTPDATRCSEPPLPAACPEPAPSAGTDCSDSTLACWYADGSRCWCSDCMGGSPYPICQTINPPQWACAALPADCPAVMPQAGSACSVPGASCGPSCELEIVCEDGVWKWRQGSCPVCAAPDTPIATPAGERPISQLRAGDLVYSVDGQGVVVVPLSRVASTPVAGHRVVRVELDTGRVLEISPGHPTADGRHFADLAAGDPLDISRSVVRASLVAYSHERTYDILPASSTGTYFAAGALVGSTLFSASSP